MARWAAAFVCLPLTPCLLSTFWIWWTASLESGHMYTSGLSGAGLKKSDSDSPRRNLSLCMSSIAMQNVMVAVVGLRLLDLKKPTQGRGGFLECATFLNFTTRLL
jgi:hypothetical protein